MQRCNKKKQARNFFFFFFLVIVVYATLEGTFQFYTEKKNS